MAKVLHNDEGIWEWEPTGELDEDGNPYGDYVLTGSYPMNQWELTVMGLMEVDLPVNMLQGIWY